MDQISCFIPWGEKRRKYYEKCKYNINFYQAFNENFLTIREYLKHHKINLNENDKNDKNDNDGNGESSEGDNKEINKLRKTFICHKFGEIEYELQKDMDFDGDYFDYNDYDSDTKFEKLFENNDAIPI